MLQLASEGFEARLEKVNYEFQRGGDRMLCVASLLVWPESFMSRLPSRFR
jgi:hypothetical protein